MDLNSLVNEAEHTPVKSTFEGPFPPSPPLTAPESQAATSFEAEEQMGSLEQTEGAGAEPQTTGETFTKSTSDLPFQPIAGGMNSIDSSVDTPQAMQKPAHTLPQAGTSSMDVDQNQSSPSLPPGLAPHTAGQPPLSRQDSTNSLAVAPRASPLDLSSVSSAAAPPSEFLPAGISSGLPSSSSVKRLAEDDLQEDQGSNKRQRQSHSPALVSSQPLQYGQSQEIFHQADASLQSSNPMPSTDEVQSKTVQPQQSQSQSDMQTDSPSVNLPTHDQPHAGTLPTASVPAFEDGTRSGSDAPSLAIANQESAALPPSYTSSRQPSEPVTAMENAPQEQSTASEGGALNGTPDISASDTTAAFAEPVHTMAPNVQNVDYIPHHAAAPIVSAADGQQPQQQQPAATFHQGDTASQPAASSTLPVADGLSAGDASQQAIPPADGPAPPPAPVAGQPVPATPAPVRPPIQRSAIQIPNNQLKYCTTMLRQLKKDKNAPPFMYPVDPVYLGIPTYYAIITDPMDLSTVEKRLLSGAYSTANEFLEDLRKIFRNCYRFNGEQAPVSGMARQLEALFSKLANKMPAETKPVSLPAPFPGYPPAASPSTSGYGSNKGKKSSMSQSHNRRESSSADRPKREIHAPPTYDELEDQMNAIPRKKKSIHALNEDARFCREVLRELTKKTNQAFAWPFLEPVDWVALQLHDYPQIVKRPMDLGTMRRKLDDGEYLSAHDFYRDFKQIVKNCKLYNKADSDVAKMGDQLNYTFDRKWADKPESSDDEGGDEQIDMMEQQLNMMRQNLREMKDAKSQRKLQKKMMSNSLKSSKSSGGPRLSNGSMKKVRKDSMSGMSGLPKKKKKRGSSDEDEPLVEVSYEMKRDLANGIASFEGDRLERAIDIIRKSRPDLLGDESKEIELDIDQLDERTLLKLYNFVVLGDKKKARRSETLTAAGTKALKGGRAGTGGLKGKSLDEDEESAKIRALEAKLQAFEGAAGIPSTLEPASSSEASEDESESESE